MAVFTSGPETDSDRVPARSRRRAEPTARTDLRRRLRRVLALMFAVDAVMIVGAVLIAARLRSGFDFLLTPVLVTDQAVSVATFFFVVVWLGALVLRGAYEHRLIGAGTQEYAAVSSASWVAAGVLGVGAFLFNAPLSRGLFLVAFGIGVPLLLVGRWLVRHTLHLVRRAGRLNHRVLVIGAPHTIGEVVDVIERQPFMGYTVVGACLPREYDAADVAGVPQLGRPDDVRALAAEHRIDTVLVTGGFASAAQLRRVGWALEGADIDLVVTPSLTEVAGTRIQMRLVAGLPLVHVEEPQSGAAGGLTKRAFDLVVSGLLLVVGAPVLLLFAAAIKLEDRGPVFFRQQRTGREGATFPMVKFRSMSVDAEARLAELVGANESAGDMMFKIKDDPRVTRVGRILRKFSIDEVPQLWNVFQGDMSLVGPRPPLGREVEKYSADHHRRLLVRPGMTGLWQVSGRSNLSWDESVRLDLYYVDNWSMASDLMIMIKTVRAVLLSKGAY